MKFFLKTLIISSCFFLPSGADAQTVFRGIVLDAVTKVPIQGAKVGVTGQGVGEITSEQGRFVYRKYHQIMDGSHQLEVSASNYQSLEMPSEELRTLLNKNSTIFLQPLQEKVSTADAPKKAHILWDASVSSGLRDPVLEKEFLLAYLQASSLDSIRFTLFNETILYDEIITTKGSSEVIEKLLNTIVYEGAADYNLLPIWKADEWVLFSESPPTFGELNAFQSIPIHTIHSSPNSNFSNYFEKLSNYTSGRYIRLHQLAVKPAVNYLLHGEIPELKEVVSSERIITGRVTSENGPVHYATISKEGSLDETYTQEDGSFKLIGRTGDTFKVMYLGKFSKYFTITEADDYSVFLVDAAEMLDEVQITGKTRRYDFDPDRNTDVFEGRDVPVRSLHKDDMKQDVSNASELINGLFGVVSNAQFTYVKGLKAEWIVDGVVRSPSEISPKNIIRISVFRPETNILSIPAARPRAKIIVTTIFHKDHVDATYRRLGYAPQKNNTYTENPRVLSFEPTSSNYLSKLKTVGSLEEKWKLYTQLQTKHSDQVDFYVDMALYFENLDIDLARRVRSDFTVVAMHNVKALRILAYLHEYAGSYLEAQKVYERILSLAPGQAESYRDLALIYQETGAYQKALELYINMLGDEIKGVDFSGLSKAISNELQHLVMLHKHKIDYQRLPNDWLQVDFNIDIRMTLAWSNADAPFEFQFVNPNNRFYNWNSENKRGNNLSSNRLIEEFIVDDAPKGKWLVNVRYTGEPGSATVAPYLKYTLYKNYGRPNESRTVKLVKLDDQLEKVTLDTFLN